MGVVLYGEEYKVKKEDKVLEERLKQLEKVDVKDCLTAEELRKKRIAKKNKKMN